jgi:very-short-patch-repair endonuclease
MSRAGKRLPWGAISQGKVATPALVAVVTRRKDWQILWERLMRAEEINDLYWTSPIEEKLYRALRRTGLEPERQIYGGGKTTGYFLHLALFCRDGALDVECDGASYHSGWARAEADRNRDNYLTVAGWRILRFSGKEIRRNTADCVRLIKELVAKLGGRDRDYSDSSNSS